MKIKRIILDRVETTEYGVEHWCKVYIQHKGNYHKIWQLVLADRELELYDVALEINLNRKKDIKQWLKCL